MLCCIPEGFPRGQEDHHEPEAKNPSSDQFRSHDDPVHRGSMGGFYCLVKRRLFFGSVCYAVAISRSIRSIRSWSSHARRSFVMQARQVTVKSSGSSLPPHLLNVRCWTTNSFVEEHPGHFPPTWAIAALRSFFQTAPLKNRLPAVAILSSLYYEEAKERIVRGTQDERKERKGKERKESAAKMPKRAGTCQVPFGKVLHNLNADVQLTPACPIVRSGSTSRSFGQKRGSSSAKRHWIERTTHAFSVAQMSLLRFIISAMKGLEGRSSLKTFSACVGPVIGRGTRAILSARNWRRRVSSLLRNISQARWVDVHLTPALGV